ncbi:MAG: large conductance mechanosensitive channel protein MscL [Clostridia bacterium]|nr:large conductance mechanosensitive channel protein MscL [Clostridia bacterium]
MKKFFAEFKEFAVKGNMLDLAVGMIIGAAFNAIVKSLVDDIIMPAVGVLIGGKDFTALSFQFKDATIAYGNLIQNLVNFLITAFCLFLVVKGINTMKRRREAQMSKPEPEPEKKSDDIVLLEQIKDTLVEIQKSNNKQ